MKSAFAHPGHYVPGNAKGEMLTAYSADLLAGGMLGTGDGVTGLVRSATFSYATPATGPAAAELGPMSSCSKAPRRRATRRGPSVPRNQAGRGRRHEGRAPGRRLPLRGRGHAGRRHRRDHHGQAPDVVRPGGLRRYAGEHRGAEPVLLTDGLGAQPARSGHQGRALVQLRVRAARKVPVARRVEARRLFGSTHRTLRNTSNGTNDSSSCYSPGPIALRVRVPCASVPTACWRTS